MTTLRRLRERKHLSLRAAATEGRWTDHVYLLRLEQGRYYPSRRTVDRLATLYGVTARTIWAAADATAGEAQS